MANRRKAMVIVAVKRFYRIPDLAEALQLEEKRLKEIAYLCGALYQIKNIQLINRGKIEVFMEKFADYVYSQEGKYVTVSDVQNALGIPRDVLLHIVAGAGSAYQIGRYTLINVEETEEFIKKFKIEISTEGLDEEIEIRRRLRYAKDPITGYPRGY